MKIKGADNQGKGVDADVEENTPTNILYYYYRSPTIKL